MRLIDRVLLLTCLFCLMAQAMAISKAPIPDAETQLQANHYYSPTDKLTTYNIKDVKEGKPLIVIIGHSKRQITSPVMVTLSQNSMATPCRFTKPRQLCVIPETTSTQIAMKIECTSLPCDVEWVIYQPQIKDSSQIQPALNLFELSQSKNHILAKVTCNNPQVKTFNKDVRVYASSEYTRAYQDNIVYLMFTQPEKGYVFVNIDTASRGCANVEFITSSGLIVADRAVQDFTTSQYPLLMDFQSKPEGEFRIEFSAKRLETNALGKASLTVSLTTDDHQKIIKRQTVRGINSNRLQDFTVIFGKVENVERKLGLKVSTQGSQTQSLVVKLVTSLPHEVEMGEQIYFDLIKDSQLKLKIPENPDVAAEQKVYLVPRRKDDIQLSASSCSVHDGCQVTVKSKSVTQNMIFLSSSDFEATKMDQSGGMFEMDEVKLIEISGRANGYIRAGDRVYLKRKITADKAIQVVVNTPNVIMYAASAFTCVIPSQQCHQRTGNSHHPFAFSSKQDTVLYITVESLQNTQFVLTILEHDHTAIPLQDAVPFAYRMDKKEQEVSFEMSIEKQTEVSFNLIAPLNDLKLLVSNSKGETDPEDAQTSWQGYIVMKKDDLKSKDFTVTVIKAKEGQYPTHFTLIVSTKHSQVRLQPGITHYQTLQADQKREMVFEFDPSQEHVLNFYAHDMKEEQISVEVLLGVDTDWEKANPLTIERDTDYLDLQAVAEWLCEEQGVGSCQLFMRLRNTAERTLDLAVTLLKRQSVIELKDGVWQGLPATDLATSAKFYFYPRHKHQDILLYYSSGLTNLKASYILWRYEPESLVPTSWPYPYWKVSFQSPHLIAINHKQIQDGCWPNCVLLVTLQLDRTKFASRVTFQNLQSIHTKIMVSNDEMQIPAKQQVSFTVGAHQYKQMLVDLTQPLAKQQVTFHATTSIGQCNIRAGLYSQQHKNCPTQADQQTSIDLHWGQTKLTAQTIKEALNGAQMGDDKESYLCVVVSATDEACKGTIEYSCDTEEEFYPLSTDTFQEVNLVANDYKFYKFDGFFQQSTKVVRQSGLPFIAIKKCPSQAQLSECMEAFRTSTDRGKQLVLKTETFQDQICQQCVYLIKVSSIEPAKLTIHLASPRSHLQLKQKVMLSDFLNEGETNQYQLHANPSQELVINIHVQEGAIQAELTDSDSMTRINNTSPENKVLQFVLLGKKKTQTDKSKQSQVDSLAMWEGLALYQVAVKSMNPSKAATYSITYSSGQREVELQDGLIVDYHLQASKTVKFSYSNNNNPEHIYLTLSAQNATALNQLKTSIFSLTDPRDSESAEELTLQKPTVNKKTTSPALLFRLPVAEHLLLELTNPSKTSFTVSLLINHRQVILLPFNQQFPLQMHAPSQATTPLEYINILVDVNIPGHLTLMVRKCDESSPTLGYTFDYDSFIKEDFMYETRLGGVPFFSYSIKAQRVGTLYIHLTADPLLHTMLSLKVVHSEQKAAMMGLRPTRLSAIDYTLEDQTRALMKVGTVTCHTPPCKGIKYYYMAATDQQQLYSQLVCPSSLFTVPGVNISSPLTLHPLKHKLQDKELEFEVQLPASESWVGVKAVSEGGEEYYYQPVEVASLLSKFSRAGWGVHLTLLFFLSIILGMIALVVKAVSRRGYERLRQQQD